MIGSTRSHPDIPTDLHAYDFQAWRQIFLRGILRTSLVVGAVFLLVTFFTNTEAILLMFYSIAYVFLLVSSILRLPYQLKAIFFLTVILLLGVSGLFENGLRGDARVWLVAFSVMAALLFGSKTGIIANGISSLILIVFGWLILTSRITILNKSIDLGTYDIWATATLINIGISALLSTGIAWLGNDFQQAQTTASIILETLHKEREGLEVVVDERTASLERKASQLQVASIVAREASVQRDPDSLLNRTVELITEHFKFYHAGIFLIDDTKEFAVLRAASSEGGRHMLHQGFRVTIGKQGIVGAAADVDRPQISVDTEKDADYLQTPELAATRSAIAIPLHVSKRIIGVLDLQSTEKEAFIEDDIQVFQILADQISLAMQNALLNTESQNIIKRLESVTLENVRKTWRGKAVGSGKAYRYTSAGLTQLNTEGTARGSKNAKTDNLAIPITLHGQQIGIIELRRKEQESWTDTDRALVIDISSQVALALENARLLEEAQQGAAQEQFLNTLTTQVGQNLDINSILETTLRELHQLPKIAEVSVYLSPTRANPTPKSDQDN